ncbi:MAG: type II CAAX prenyl endopeptidase Rce1 family protein [Candidatus Hermodarchaeota archaeon]
MKKAIKNSLMFLLLIGLIIPIFFGVYIEFLFITLINFSTFLIFALILIGFLGLTKLVGIFFFDSQSLEAMKKHNVVNAFIFKKNKNVLVNYFLMIMIVEELIFRYYLIGYLVKDLGLEINLAIFLSSIMFSLYHVHTWFAYKNLKITIIYLSLAFLLGLYNGYILITLGIIPCVIIHYGLVLYLYYGLYKRTLKIEI